jgi:CDGSH-type Zn-finger protein
MPEEQPPATITAYPNGPLIVRGHFDLRTVDGEPIEHRSGAVALCRCGLSSIKPFCDATHKRSKFRAD